MNTKRIISSWGTGVSVIIFLVAFVLLVPTGAEAEHCKGKHKNDPGCGDGGGGSSDVAVPLITIFDCPVIGADHLSCPAIGSHNRLQADVAGAPYENDLDNVLNQIGKSGRFALSTGKRPKKFKPRSVYWDVTHVNGGVELPNGGLVFTTTEDMDAQEIVHRTVIHVGTQFTGQGGDLRAMQPGENVNVDLWADIFFDTGQGGDVVLLRFDPYGSDQCNQRITSAVQLTRSDDGSGKRQWTIDVPFGAVACVKTLGGDLGDYVFGPFQLITDEL